MKDERWRVNKGIVSIPASGGEAGLNRYLAEIKKFPILAPEEEYMLAKRWREHDDTDAAAKLVNSHLRLVAKIAMGYRGYGLPVSELISEGNIGLMQGVKKFEPDRGFRLATYAMWWIRASIQEFILRSWSLVKMGTTAAQKKLFFNLRRMKNQIDAFEEGDLKPGDVTKIATDLGVTEDEVVSMNRRMAMGGDTSLNAPLRDTDGEGQWQDFLVDTGPLQDEMIADDEESRVRHDLLIERDGQPQRPREAHPDRTAADRRAEDARGPEPGLRRQPRAHPPDRGAGVREAAGGVAQAGRRASAAGGVAGRTQLAEAAIPPDTTLPLLPLCTQTQQLDFLVRADALRFLAEAPAARACEKRLGAPANGTKGESHARRITNGTRGSSRWSDRPARARPAWPRRCCSQPERPTGRDRPPTAIQHRRFEPEAAQRGGSTELNLYNFNYLGDQFAILDAPGSVGFAADGARAMAIADVAIVVVDPDPARAALAAPALRVLDELGIPHLIFVNRIDQAHGRIRDLLTALSR